MGSEREYAETNTGSTGEMTRMREPELWQRRSTVVENFQKRGDQRWRITYIIRSRAGPANIPAAIPPVPYSIFVSIPPSLSVFPGIVNPARTRGWIPACPRSQGPARRNYERDENRERRDRMCFTSVIFSFPTGAGARAQ